MAKKQDFARKVKGNIGEQCPKCETVYQFTQVITPNVNEGAIKFNKANVKVCKCNEKEVYS